ncbi:MAG TPA: TolC family protein [Flavobacteriales bacterium]|nr:TolC family protein [Flavobacteriales bacterium]
MKYEVLVKHNVFSVFAELRFTNTYEKTIKAVSKKSLIYVLAFLPLISRAQDTTSTSFTLNAAIAYAEKNSPLVKNAQKDIDIFKQRQREITAMGLPQLNVEASFNHFLNIPTTVVPASAFSPGAPDDLLVPVQFGTKYQTSAGATLSQLVFDGSYFVAIKTSKTALELQTLLEQKTTVDVKNEVVKAYYMAAIADENIKTLGTTLVQMEKLKGETEAIQKEGLIEKQDVEQLELTVQGMRNNIMRAENMKKMAYNLLKLNMGIDVRKEITITQSIDSLNAAFNPADYVSREFTPAALPEYKLLQTQVKLGEYTLMNEKAKYYPSLGAFITHSYNLPSNNLDMFDNRRWFPTTIWGLKLTVPVFASGMRQAKVQQAKMGLEKSVTTMQNAENGLKLAAENARLNLNFSLESLNTLKQSLELADRIQQKTLIKYKEGISTSLELNQAQMQYLNAQANYINGLYTVLNSKAEMDKAYGTLANPSSK